MRNIDILGYIAAACTTCAFVPQVVQAWRTRDLTNISLSMYALFFVGIGLWLAYGVVMGAWPIIVANVITLALSGMILAMKGKQVLGEKKS